MSIIVFSIVIVLYVIQCVVLLLQVKKKFVRRKEADLPTAVVIVAARNEEQNILRCLESLENLEYPDGKLSIIIVDDQSTDNTAGIIDRFIAGKERFQKLSTEEAPTALQGKSRAIAWAIQNSNSEIIITTDADCAVPPLWVKSLASYYTDGVGVVNGYTHVHATGVFAGMQSLDFMYLLTVAAGSINAGYPISCIGNNMSYARKAYTEAGGYEQLPFCVTEDSQLLLAISKLKNFVVRFPLNREALVTSLACPDLLSLFRQKKRWAVGGLYVPRYAYLVLLIGWLANAGMLAAGFFFDANAASLMLVKILVDFILLKLVCNEMGIAQEMRFFPVFSVYSTVYAVFLPFVLLFGRRIVWKGRKF